MTVFMSVACGAGMSFEPNVYALPSSSTVPATAQQANAAPMNWPSCWRAGVAPTRIAGLQVLGDVARLRRGDGDDRADGEHGRPGAGIRPARGGEHGGDAEQGHERDPRGRLGGDADDADDPRGDRHEEKAEDADPGCAHGALERAPCRRRRSRDERGGRHHEQDRAHDEGGRAGRGRSAPAPRSPCPCLAGTSPPKHGGERAPHRRKIRAATVRIPAAATAPAPM